MAGQNSFPNLRKRVAEFRLHPELCQSKEGLVSLICHDCEFWREDEKDYECGAFKLLRTLLEKRVLTVQGIIDGVVQ